MKYWQQVVVLLITCPVSFKTFTVAHATVVFHLGKAACNSCLCNQLANSIMIEFTSQHTTWHDSQINPQICTVLDILSCDLSSYPLVHLPYASLVSVHLAHPAAGAQTERCLLPPAVPHPHIHHFLRNLKGWNSPSRCTLTNYKHTANYKHMNDWFSKKTPGRCSILKSWHHLRVMGDVTLYLKTKLTANEITWSCRTICFIFISSIFDDLIWFDMIWWYLPILLMPRSASPFLKVKWRFAQLPTSDSPCFAVPTCSNFPWLSPKKPQIWPWAMGQQVPKGKQ